MTVLFESELGHDSTTPQMAAIVMVLARAVVISSSNFESHGWKHVVATRAHVVVD